MQNIIKNPKYDLQERTAKFGEDAIEFALLLPETAVNRPLISQFVRSSTSTGANYMEADGAESKKDFEHKTGIARKEAKETTHWLRMIAKANPDKKEQYRVLWKEAHELALIFSKIIINSRKKK